MKAVQINSYGDTNVLEIKSDIPQPPVEKESVLVEVHATSINPFDYKLREGYMKEMIPLHFPVILGGDFAGIVTEVGENVSEYKKDDEVYGTALVVAGGSGAEAEYATVKTKSMSFKPKTLNFVDASSLPLVGSSTVQALEEHMNLQSGQKILIHGGAGGIGTMAIQLAKSIGAYVATTVSTDDIEYVKMLGADEVIDYKNQKFEELLNNFDAVYDTVGGETTDKSFLVLKKGGILVSMVGKPNEDLKKKYEVKGISQFTQTNTAHLKRVSELVDSGKIKTHIDKEFSLDQVKEAYEYQEKIHPRGKVVIKIKD